MLLVLTTGKAPSSICRSSLPRKQLTCSIQRELVLLMLLLLLQRHNRSAGVAIPRRHWECKLLLLHMQLTLLSSQNASSRVVAAMLRHQLLLPLQKHLLRGLLLLFLQPRAWAIPKGDARGGAATGTHVAPTSARASSCGCRIGCCHQLLILLLLWRAASRERLAACGRTPPLALLRRQLAVHIQPNTTPT
jgi:hypothetical protein